jgi:O-antigen/teichoic acid export membrane protein
LSKILLFFGLVVLIFYFKVGLENLKYAIIYYVILMALPAVIYSIYFLTQFGFPFEFDKSIFKKAIDFGLRSYVSCLLAFLVLRSDIYLINVFRGLYDVGLYSLAVSFSDGILLIVSSITLVLLPKITAEQNQSSEFTLRIARLVSVIMIFILFCSFIGARFVIKFLFGDSFLPSLLPFYILLPAIYFWSLSSILTQLFVSKGYPWFSVFIWLPGLVINVILNILFIPYYGIVVAAWTSLLAYFLNFLLHYFYFQKYRKTSLKEIIIPSFDEIRSFLRI